MIIGVGTDIVRVARIKKIVEKSETKFIDRILTPKAVSYTHLRAHETN